MGVTSTTAEPVPSSIAAKRCVTMFPSGYISSHFSAVTHSLIFSPFFFRESSLQEPSVSPSGPSHGMQSLAMPLNWSLLILMNFAESGPTVIVTGEVKVSADDPKMASARPLEISLRPHPQKPFPLHTRGTPRSVSPP